MKRTPSALTQTIFDLHSSLISRFHSKKSFSKLAARVAARITRPLLRSIGKGHTVTATIYGNRLLMPSEHPILLAVTAYPQYNRPLGLAAVAIARRAPFGTKLTAVDVGANIGETAALIEQWQPDSFSYLCLEPEPDLAEMCRINHKHRNNVEVRQCFIGEDEGAVVELLDDGRANPSTKPSSTASSTGGRLVRLDTAVASFAETYKGLSLIKVDTEGYDFAVLRSGSKILKQYQPAVYFEWFPDALTAVGDDLYKGFFYLQSLGYRYFVIFTSQGDFYCNSVDPDSLFLRGLASALGPRAPFEYFDVFASVSEEVASTLVELSITINEKNHSRGDRNR